MREGVNFVKWYLNFFGVARQILEGSKLGLQHYIKTKETYWGWSPVLGTVILPYNSLSLVFGNQKNEKRYFHYFRRSCLIVYQCCLSSVSSFAKYCRQLSPKIRNVSNVLLYSHPFDTCVCVGLFVSVCGCVCQFPSRKLNVTYKRYPWKLAWWKKCIYNMWAFVA